MSKGRFPVDSVSFSGNFFLLMPKSPVRLRTCFSEQFGSISKLYNDNKNLLDCAAVCYKFTSSRKTI